MSEDPTQPQSPAPGDGPQSSGPQSPGPGAPPPVPPQPDELVPARPPGSAPPPPPAAPVYGGPVPPGGWQQPLTAPAPYAGQYAGWWTRAGAQLIDFLVIVTPALLLTVLIGFGIVGGVQEATADEAAVGIAIVLAALLFYGLAIVTAIIYIGLTMRRAGGCNGQTWGKQVLACRVVRADGRELTFWSSVVRNVVVQFGLFWLAGGILFNIPTLLNYLWPLWDDQDRCLHDMICDTRVVGI